MITVAQTSGCHHHATPSQPIAAGQVLQIEGLVELAVDPVPDAPQPREVVTALFGRGHALSCHGPRDLTADRVACAAPDRVVH